MDENLTQTQQSVVPPASPTAPPVQPPKGKKSLVLMIAIHIIAVAVIGYFVYQNIQLKKQLSLPQSTPITVTPSTPSTNPTTLPENTSECSGNDKYSITIQGPSQDNAISEFLVKYKDGGSNFDIKEEVAYCIGLENNFLVLDTGTSAGPRGLIVYDLDKRVKVFNGVYVGNKPVISNNTISYWEPSNEVATAENCPDFSINASHGGSSAIDVYTKLNLLTLKKELLGQTKCDYRE